MNGSVKPPPRVAIVTGAAQGIGAGIALRLAREGFALCLTDLLSSQDKLSKVASACRASGSSVFTVDCDVSREDQVAHLVKTCAEELGSLDVMIANAGIARFGPFIETRVEDLDAIYSVNVRGVFLCYREAAKQMISQGTGGRLIAACSTSGLRTGPNASAYCSSKFAVRALNQGAALEFGKHKITANVFCPTVVETDMWADMDRTIADLKGWKEGEYTRQRAEINPMGRNATVDDIAGLVAFLVGPDSSYVTGQALQVTGGDWLS